MPIFSFIALIFYFIWVTIKAIFSLIWKIICDIAKNVYGRIIIFIGGSIFAYMMYYFSHFHK